MRHMVGPDWRQLFDVVIVQADKPSFFTDRRKYGPVGEGIVAGAGSCWPGLGRVGVGVWEAV